MTKIFDDIRSSMPGVVGSFILDSSGELVASDVPPLFAGELESLASNLYYLSEVAKDSKSSFTKMMINGTSGHIAYIVGGDASLGIVTSKSCDTGLLELVETKAVAALDGMDLSALSMHGDTNIEITAAAEVVAATDTGVVATTTPSATEEPKTIKEESRLLLCSGVKKKIRLMYGPKVAESKMIEAFEAIGAERQSNNPAELGAMLDHLAGGILKKLMGPDRAKEFVAKLKQEYEL